MKKRARRTAGLDRALSAVHTPVFLLDARRRVTFFNTGCEHLAGWPAADVLGRVCDYVTDPAPDSLEALTASLCPPPGVLSGQSAAVPAYLPRRGAAPRAHLLNFFPLVDADGRLEAVLGLVTPMGEPPRPAAVSPARQLHAELAALRVSLRQRFGLRTVIARGEAMLRVLHQVELARASRTPVCLHGEPGTGKEHLARVIHYESDLRGRSFVPLDCLRSPAFDLKQALRRALRLDGGEEPREGPAGLHPGTLYLAHVERLPRDLQQLVVEAFQPASPMEPSPRSVASPPDVRLMAATTADLDRAVEQEILRRDLYFLLTPVVIELPPLRRRPEDLAPLAQWMLEDLNRGEEKQVGGFSEEVWRQFREYNWPGNLDELAAVISEARAACTGELIDPDDLPFRFRTGFDAQSVGPPVAPRTVPLEEHLAKIEREEIERALAQARHNKSRAADLLGLTRPRLYRRMQALGIADLEEPRE